LPQPEEENKINIIFTRKLPGLFEEIMEKALEDHRVFLGRPGDTIEFVNVRETEETLEQRNERIREAITPPGSMVNYENYDEWIQEYQQNPALPPPAPAYPVRSYTRQDGVDALSHLAITLDANARSHSKSIERARKTRWDNAYSKYINDLSVRYEPRYCFECGVAMTFWGFWRANKGKSLKELKRTWKKTYIEIRGKMIKFELFCCKCYKYEERVVYTDR